ncbi:MAG: biopolymer transporter ExbD [Verrucomicrobiales bacterium]|nr:biopolymer transporter ExbD [Verrucomicrobiales bacterium]
MASKALELQAVDEDVSVDQSSMIDLVFQLLLFFMVSSRLLLNTIDPDIKLPVAPNAKPPEEHAGRIIIHVYNDGGFSGKNRKEEPLPDLASVRQYVTGKVGIIEQGVTPKVLLRGDKEAIVKYAKQVIQAAGDAGVNNIIFSAYPTAKK